MIRPTPRLARCAPCDRLLPLLGLLILAGLGWSTVDASDWSADESSYYKVLPLFHPFPEEGKSIQSIDRFGPVGIGIELLQPPFMMRIRNVEEGSPAAATGTLKPGQWIDSINGRVMKERDPRLILGDIIARAEATDGLVKLVVRDGDDAAPREVVVTIPVLGDYSDTWPRNCPKSDRIVRGFAEYLKRTGKDGMGLGSLFLLSTGDDSDLEFVRERMQRMAAKNKDKKTIDLYPWYIGYGGPAICEYYLRTGDASVLHTIQLYADHLRDTMYNDAWGGKGIGAYPYMAGGHMNAAGVHCVTFLLLAKECGVDVDAVTLQRSLRHFFRFAGRGNVSYGDGLPERSFVDNGKTGGLAFAMAAAASLSPEGEQSVYARARDICAQKSFYSTSWMLHGHTGGGIGEIWRGSAMGFLHEKRAKKYQEFMDHRAWFYDLSRRYDGSFGIIGGGRYDAPGHWGNGMGLVYTMPRKTLQMTGAPKTPFCKSYQLPTRPWGNDADDRFYDLDATAVPGGEPQDVAGETLPEGSSLPVLRRLRDPDLTEKALLEIAYHPELGLREYAVGRIKSRGLQAEAIAMLKSEDPRIRHAGMMALPTMDQEATELMIAMVVDPQESWWVAKNAMDRLGSVDPELLAPHVARLTHWLKHDDWWLRGAAMTAATKLAADKRFYKEILPIISDMVVNNTHAVALSPLAGIVGALQQADPEVQAYAIEVLAAAYARFPALITNPAGNDVPTAAPYLIENLARNLSGIPGGFDALYDVSRQRNPGKALPHKSLYMNADTARFGPKVKEALKPVVLDYLIPQYMGVRQHPAPNRHYLLKEANSEKIKQGFYYRGPRMDGLVALYQRIGIHDYDWKDFGPGLNEMTWDYFSFDPPETKLPGSGVRYRKVTLPVGMENWFATDFDAAKAGWKRGKQPFGQVDGELVTERSDCRFDFCRHGEPMQTLWDKEVLLARGTFRFPKLRDGHRYRLLMGGVSHVNWGEGFRIYVNGKLLMEKTSGTPRRGGGRPIGYMIDKPWWPEFGNGDTTIAATTFLQIGNASKKGRFFLWLQEMKVPPLTDELFERGRLLQPMRCTAWQASKNDADMFHYDANFVDNPAVAGEWVQLGKVAYVDDFEPGKTIPADPKWPLLRITLGPDGKTDDPNLVWSDTTLMDLGRLEALQITPATIAGTDYLFIEAGNFSKPHRNGWSPDHPEDWTPELYVMKRKTE